MLKFLLKGALALGAAGLILEGVKKLNEKDEGHTPESKSEAKAPEKNEPEAASEEPASPASENAENEPADWEEKPEE